MADAPLSNPELTVPWDPRRTHHLGSRSHVGSVPHRTLVSVPNHLEDEHPGLVDVASQILLEIRQFDARLRRVDEVDHDQHRVFMGRAFRLVQHLEAGVTLTQLGLSASALVLMRTALEHQLVDRLLHCGTRFEQVFTGVDDAALANLVERYNAQEERWFRAMAEPPRRVGADRAAVVIRGMADSNEDPATATYLLHPLYFEIDHYSPTIGRPSDQGSFDDGIGSLDERIARARRNRALWHKWLRWDGLKRNLVLNGMVDERELFALDVHYGYLSGFTHATNAGYDDVSGRHNEVIRDAREAFAQELVFLYVVTIGAAELELLATMQDRPPPLEVAGRAEVDDVVMRARKEAAHLWFLGGQPHKYDRFVELNRRAWRAHRDGAPMHEVSNFADAEIPYYRDPMERLTRLHQSSREMTTGLVYESQWRNPSSYA